MLVSILLVPLVIMLAFPATPTGRALHRVLVEAPVRWMSELTPAKAGKMLLLGAALCLLLLMGPETVMLFAAAGGDMAAVELMLAVWLASMSGGIGSVWRVVKRIGRLARSARRTILRRNHARSRRRRPGARSRGRNDDKAEPDWAFA